MKRIASVFFILATGLPASAGQDLEQTDDESTVQEFVFEDPNTHTVEQFENYRNIDPNQLQQITQRALADNPAVTILVSEVDANFSADIVQVDRPTLGRRIKGWFSRPYQKERIALSVLRGLGNMAPVLLAVQHFHYGPAATVGAMTLAGIWPAVDQYFAERKDKLFRRLGKRKEDALRLFQSASFNFLQFGIPIVTLAVPQPNWIHFLANVSLATGFSFFGQQRFDKGLRILQQELAKTDPHLEALAQRFRYRTMVAVSTLMQAAVVASYSGLPVKYVFFGILAGGGVGLYYVDQHPQWFSYIREILLNRVFHKAVSCQFIFD